MVIRNIIAHQAAQVRFIEDEHMVEKLSAADSNPALLLVEVCELMHHATSFWRKIPLVTWPGVGGSSGNGAKLT